MGTILYIAGLACAVLAVIDIFKKRISMAGKVMASLLVLLTNWFGVVVYYFYAKDPVQRLRYLVLAAAFGSCPDAGTPEVSDGRPWNPCPFRQELWRELCAMIRQNPHRFLRDPLTAEVAVLFRPELIRHASGPFVCGERLAMRAFQRGAFDDCRKLLAASRSDSPVRLFLEARLARRDGDGGRAAELLRKWLELDRRRKEPQAAERSAPPSPIRTRRVWKRCSGASC